MPIELCDTCEGYGYYSETRRTSSGGDRFTEYQKCESCNGSGRHEVTRETRVKRKKFTGKIPKDYCS